MKVTKLTLRGMTKLICEFQPEIAVPSSESAVMAWMSKWGTHLTESDPDTDMNDPNSKDTLPWWLWQGRDGTACWVQALMGPWMLESDSVLPPDRYSPENDITTKPEKYKGNRRDDSRTTDENWDRWMHKNGGNFTWARYSDWNEVPINWDNMKKMTRENRGYILDLSPEMMQHAIVIYCGTSVDRPHSHVGTCLRELAQIENFYDVPLAELFRRTTHMTVTNKRLEYTICKHWHEGMPCKWKKSCNSWHLGPTHVDNEVHRAD
jgi:hypothetical protein